MIEILAAAAWAVLITTLIGRAVQQFRGYATLDEAQPPEPGTAPTVTMIVPARNEALNIERCVSSLLAQNYPAQRLQLAVVDDHSTDETAGIVRRLAQRDHRLQLLSGATLPPGWTGKSFVCSQGAATATGDWLCFLDADTASQPGLLSSAVAAAIERQVDMLSLEPFQELGTFWERLIVPAGLFLIACTQDLQRVNDPRSDAALANGQFILIRRPVYEGVGGHAAVRSEICEDTALARRVKRTGGRIAVLGAENFIRTRMYTGLEPLWQGLAKNVTEMAGGIVPALGKAAGAMVLAWLAILLPLWTWAAWLQSGGALMLAAAVLATMGSLALLGVHLGTARHLRIPPWYGLLFPLAYHAAALLLCDGVARRWRRKVAWKGRTYQPQSSSPTG